MSEIVLTELTTEDTLNHMDIIQATSIVEIKGSMIISYPCEISGEFKEMFTRFINSIEGTDHKGRKINREYYMGG